MEEARKKKRGRGKKKAGVEQLSCDPENVEIPAQGPSDPAIKLYTPFGDGDNRNITPLCKDRYKSKKAILDHVNKAIDDCFKNDHDERVEKIVATISSIFTVNTITMYGPYSWGLVDKTTDLVYICLNTPKSFDKVLEIFKELPNLFLILDEKSVGPTTNFIIFQDEGTKTRCALTTAHGKSCPDITLSTKIFLFYLMLDPRVEWLLVAIRTWWSMNFVNWQDQLIKGEFVLEWMVIFFLMSPGIKLIPPIGSIISNPKANMSEWENFIIDSERVKDEHDPMENCQMENIELLIHFFYFYENINFDSIQVLCLFSGKILEYNEFINDCADYYSNDSNEIIIPAHLSLMNPVTKNHDMFQNMSTIKFRLLVNKFYSTLSHIIHS